MSVWHEFYDMVGAAAATLMGLLFVSVSLNADLILGSKNRHSKRLAEQAFQNFIAALVVSLLVLIPDVSERDFGFSLVGVSLPWGVWVLVRAFQSFMTHTGFLPRLTALRRFLAPTVASGLLIWSGFEMSSGRRGFQGSIAVAVILMLISATAVAWQLLIKVAEEKYASRDT